MPRQRRLRRIIFTPYWALDFTPPPPPPTPAEIEAWELAAELLGRPVDASVMERLQAKGVDFRAHLPGAVLPGALLRRLRELKKTGRQFQDLKSMDWGGDTAGSGSG